MKKFGNFILGFSLSFVLGIVIYTVGEFVSVELKISEASSLYLLLTLGSAFLTLILGTYLWMKYTSIKSFLIFIILVTILYFIGKSFADNVSKPFLEAKQLEMESATIFNSWMNAPLTAENFDKYLSDTRMGIAKLDKARSLNFGYETWIQKHYQDLYELRSEMYETDEKIGRGELKLTQAESDLKVGEYQERIDNLKSIPLYPFWMTLYGIKF